MRTADAPLPLPPAADSPAPSRPVHRAGAGRFSGGRRSSPGTLGAGEFELVVLASPPVAGALPGAAQPLRTGLVSFNRDGALGSTALQWAAGLQSAQLMVSRHLIGSVDAWRCDEILQLDDIAAIGLLLDGELSVPLSAVVSVLEGLQQRGHRVVIIGGTDAQREALSPWAQGFLRGFDGSSSETGLAVLWAMHFSLAEAGGTPFDEVWLSIEAALGPPDTPSVLLPMVWRDRPFAVHIHPWARRLLSRAHLALLTPFGSGPGPRAALELSDWLREGPCRDDLRIAHTEMPDAWLPPGSRPGLGAAFLLARLVEPVRSLAVCEDTSALAPDPWAQATTLPGELEVAGSGPLQLPVILNSRPWM